jgi:bifunctional NMN adenylyltransferase/nudix hydrolase
MVMERKGQKSDVGVIVARFQVPSLHEGHVELIDTVRNDCQKIIIILGLSPLKVTRNNTLDFAARKSMIMARFPEAQVMYIKNMRDDTQWSKKLDAMIAENCSPEAKITLYGSRDAFTSYYHGRYPTVELVQKSYISGTSIRAQVAHKYLNTDESREGAFWAVYNQYVGPDPTVDIAIIDGDRLLLGRKKDEPGFRFIGGYVECGESAESAASREVLEETGLEIGGEAGLKFIGTCPIMKDWRYRGEPHNPLTTFFYAPKIFGRPQPADDIDQLEWFEIEDIAAIENDDYGKIVVEEHIPLMKMFIDRVVRKQ